VVKKKLEERLRYCQANPEDHGAIIQMTLSFLRADRPLEARKLLQAFTGYPRKRNFLMDSPNAYSLSP
jgi:hypothetical protein